MPAMLPSLRFLAPLAGLAALAALPALAAGPAAPKVAPAAHAAHPRSALPWIEDDYPGALARAKQRKVPLFVESWAPW